MNKSGSYAHTLIALLLVVFLPGAVCRAEEKVYEGDYVINSPAQLRALSGYTEVTGDLIIGSVPAYVFLFEDRDIIIENVLLGTEPSLIKIRNLDGLESLTTIGGDLRIGGVGWMDVPMPNPKLRNIDGLCSLKSVGGEVYIANNRSLTNIDGLNSLETIGDQLLISRNLSLASLDGLGNLTTVGGGVCIQYHTLLAHIDGLNNLTSVGGGVKIRYNRFLKDVSGMNNLTSIPNLQIHENKSLAAITGFSQLTSIGDGPYSDSPYDRLYIYENPRLSDIDGLEQVSSVGGDLFIYCNSDELDSDRDQLKDRLMAEGWPGCWDFTCDDTNNPVCPSAE